MVLSVHPRLVFALDLFGVRDSFRCICNIPEDLSSSYLKHVGVVVVDLIADENFRGCVGEARRSEMKKVHRAGIEPTALPDPICDDGKVICYPYTSGVFVS